MVIQNQNYGKIIYSLRFLVVGGGGGRGVRAQRVEADNLSQLFVSTWVEGFGGGGGPGAVRVAKGSGPRVGDGARVGELTGPPVPREGAEIC